MVSARMSDAEFAAMEPRAKADGCCDVASAKAAARAAIAQATGESR